MKKVLSTAIFISTLAIMTTSCNKEYTCECDNGAYSTIIEASSQSDAQTECNTKGTNCQVK